MAEPEPVLEGVSCNVQIENVRGLHARAAAKFCAVAEAYDADVVVKHKEMEVDGCSLMDLLMLGAGKGCTLNISAKGAQQEEVLDTLTKLISDKFGEGK